MVSCNDKGLIQYLMGSHAFESDGRSEQFHFINNRDGSIRWIYPANSKKPYFLSFYSKASFRAKLFCLFVQILFALNLRMIVKSGSLMLTLSKESRLGSVLNDYHSKSFSIFTGTAGSNRKMIVAVHDELGVDLFIKVGVSNAAKKLVLNEAAYLEKLNVYSLGRVVVPKLKGSNGLDTIVISNVMPQQGTQRLTFGNMHIRGLAELYRKTFKRLPLSKTNILAQINARLNNLSDLAPLTNGLDAPRVTALVGKCQVLTNIVEKKYSDVSLAAAHGDFTPWNMYCGGQSLYLFDWEMAQLDMPVFFDLFHFVFQSRVLVSRASYSEIYDELRRIMQLEEVRSESDEFSVDSNFSYIFYLIYNISYYLEVYCGQEALHDQAFWLLETWESAVSDALEKEGLIFE